MKMLSMAFMFLALGFANAHEFSDMATVKRVTPRYIEINRPISSCQTSTETAPPKEKGIAGAIIGGVAGGLLGSRVGKGNGKVAAGAVGAAVGAVVGDRVQNADNNDTKNVVRNVIITKGFKRVTLRLFPTMVTSSKKKLKLNIVLDKKYPFK